MNIHRIETGDIINAKLRAANRVNLDGYPMLDRARAALLSYAKSFEDWDEINGWFDELARAMPKQEPELVDEHVPF